jgi:hypothetical protein
MNLTLTGLNAALADLSRLKTGGPMATARALDRIGRIARAAAIENAPRSPTSEQIAALRKTRGPTNRKATASSRPMPGGLERSISLEVTPTFAAVFVAANSEAGDYAAIIHDAKGEAWQDRGPGTIAKGTQADEKFIERAIADNAETFDGIVESEHRKLTGATA